MTAQTTLALDGLFDGGLPRRLEMAVRLVRSDNCNTNPRAVIVWAPLVLLAVMRRFALGQDKLSDLLLAFPVHARYSIVCRCSLWRSSLHSRRWGAVNIALPFLAVLFFEILLNVISPALMKLLL